MAKDNAFPFAGFTSITESLEKNISLDDALAVPSLFGESPSGSTDAHSSGGGLGALDRGPAALPAAGADPDSSANLPPDASIETLSLNLVSAPLSAPEFHIEA